MALTNAHSWGGPCATLQRRCIAVTCIVVPNRGVHVPQCWLHSLREG